MSGRSWMAALTLTTGLIAVGRAEARADDPKPAPSPPAPAATAPAPKPTPSNTVELELFIAGLSVKGCDLEIKPAHAACTFPVLKQHVGRDGRARITVPQVRSESADRDCSFAITIIEAGQPPRTLYRGLRLKPAQGNTTQVLTCFLSSPSRVARIASESSATPAKR